jgi:hypothetical protein
LGKEFLYGGMVIGFICVGLGIAFPPLIFLGIFVFIVGAIIDKVIHATLPKLWRSYEHLEGGLFIPNGTNCGSLGM